MLSTITSVWQRGVALRIWFEAVKAATQPGMKHFIFFVGEHVPDWMQKELQYNPAFILVSNPKMVPGEKSIGFFHNEGARMASTEWMMKLDVDAIPNVRYFKELLPILQNARPREWFNGGMLLLNRDASYSVLAGGPLTEDVYKDVMLDRITLASPSYPVSTNFICRRQDYLDLGGCLDGFKGWGWEDYQQIYMLESHHRQCDPLPGDVNISNVTSRCRDEISRPRAKQLWMRNSWLCLLHRWHEPNREYRQHSSSNRKLLLYYVLSAKSKYEGRLATA